MGVKIDVSIRKILGKIQLDEKGSAQKRFVSRAKRYMDSFVPLDFGTLKNSAKETEASVEYVTPYAKRQYYENKGSKSDKRRGRYWDKRMLAEKGSEFLKETEADLKGRLK